MTSGITLEELLAWSDESTRRWFGFLQANSAVLDLPSGIYGTADVLGLVKHIVVVETRHGQRLAGEPVAGYEQFPDGPLDALLAVHEQAVARFRHLLADPNADWLATIDYTTLTAGTLHDSRRKIFAHAQLHSIRHWAQLATLARAAGIPSGIMGDLLASSALA
jgi:uncharacterized damage-inducible protein DinB